MKFQQEREHVNVGECQIGGSCHDDMLIWDLGKTERTANLLLFFFVGFFRSSLVDIADPLSVHFIDKSLVSSFICVSDTAQRVVVILQFGIFGDFSGLNV